MKQRAAYRHEPRSPLKQPFITEANGKAQAARYLLSSVSCTRLCKTPVLRNKYVQFPPLPMSFVNWELVITTLPMTQEIFHGIMLVWPCAFITLGKWHVKPLPVSGKSHLQTVYFSSCLHILLIYLRMNWKPNSPQALMCPSEVPYWDRECKSYLPCIFPGHNASGTRRLLWGSDLHKDCL